jgi:hypothetical protein
MEKFADAIVAANCSPTMTLQFMNNQAFQAARASFDWVNNGVNHTFILVGDPTLCKSGNFRDPWAISHANFEQSRLTIHLDATKKTWREAAYSYTLDFGNLAQILRKRQPRFFTINGIPAFDSVKDLTFPVATSWPESIWKVDHSPKWSFTADCVDCGTKGSVALDGHIAGNLLDGITVMNFAISPRSMKAEVNLELELKGDFLALTGVPGDASWEILRVPIDSLEAPGVVNIGPSLGLDTGYKIEEAKGDAKLSTGLAANIPEDSIIQVDFVGGKLLDQHGWIPELEVKPLDIDAQVTLKAQVWTTFEFNASFVLFPSKFSLKQLLRTFVQSSLSLIIASRISPHPQRAVSLSRGGG